MENITVSVEEYKKLIRAQAAAEFILTLVDGDTTVYLDKKATQAILILLGRYNNDTV